MTENLHHEEEEKSIFEEEEEEPTPPEGSGSGKPDDQKASDEAFLKRVNEIEGREYKSIEDYQKTVKERAKAFSEEGRQKKEEPKKDTVPYSELEVLFYGQTPEAELVRDDLKKVAQAKGISEIQAWKEEIWLQDKAKAIAAKNKELETNQKKPMAPSGDALYEGEKTDEDKIADRLSTNLPPGFTAEPRK